jgi:hypothetical protein
LAKIKNFEIVFNTKIYGQIGIVEGKTSFLIHSALFDFSQLKQFVLLFFSKRCKPSESCWLKTVETVLLYDLDSDRFD